MWAEAIGINFREPLAPQPKLRPARRKPAKVSKSAKRAKPPKARKRVKRASAGPHVVPSPKESAPKKAARKKAETKRSSAPSTHAYPADITSIIDEAGFDPRKIEFSDPGLVQDVLQERPPKATIQQVWFGTNHTRDESKEDLAFTDQYSKTVTYGWCDVQIPEWHRVGSLGSSWHKRWRSGNDDRLRIVDAEALEATAFWKEIASAVAAAPAGERHAVVWIHGYKNSFEDAALRAGQFGADLKIAGAMGFFAWASRDSRLKYMGDESAIESSEHQIEKFLIAFATQSGADAVHVIAHSMGNRAITRIVDRMVLRAQAGSGVRFGQVILAAPDVNEHLFANIAQAYKEVSKRTTIYVSSRDLALKLSAFLHGTSPAGGSNNRILTVDGLDTVVASYVETGILGHDYIATSREFITDIYDLIHHGSPPKKRVGLEAVVDKPYRYWVMRPSA
jgi:esterase/lipase superfamily enzyme